MDTKNEVVLNLNEIKTIDTIAELTIYQLELIHGGKAQYDAFAQLN